MSPARPSRRPPPRRGAPPPAKARAKSSSRQGIGGEQVEGRQAVRELLLAGRRKVREILITPEAAASESGHDLVELAAHTRVLVRTVGRAKLDAAARTEAPQGVIAYAAPLPEVDLDDLVGRGGATPFLVAVDGVTDPGNLGALLRSAECAGATGAVLPRHRAVHVTPAVAKAAAGAIEYLPIAVVGGLPNALQALQKAGVWIVGLDMGGAPLEQLPFGDDPVCLVLGAEGAGLSRLVRQRCDALASIPLRGRLSSLNVAAAAAIACHEVARRRKS